MNDPAKILVVDDDAAARETVEALLLPNGYHLLFADSGSRALTMLEAESVDLVLCDVMMPDMSGFEVCRRTKDHDQWCLIPVVLITALDGNEDIVEGLESGAEEFLSKPVSGIVLRARVRSMLRVRAHYDRLRGQAPDLSDLLRARRERLADEANLSAREREVLDLLLLGRNHEEIGTVLDISPRTSRFHQANVLQKLGADSRTDLLRLFL